MEKNNLLVPRNRNLLKLLVTMKLCVLFLLISVASATANSVYSQNAKLSLHLRQATVREVLDQIERKSEFIFVYYDGVLDLNRKVTINVKDATVDKILNEVFQSSNNTYKIFDRQIVIGRKNVVLKQLKNIKDVKLDMSSSEQKKTIKGTVEDKKGHPIAGASILVRGTTVGTVTDVNGNFQLNMSPDYRELIISYIGMKTKGIAISGKSVFSIVLEEDNVGVDEVVVVGYGVQKKVDLTGAVKSVDSKALIDRPIPNIAVGLQGLIPNLNITVSSGRSTEVPTFNIRGVTSLSGGSPLIVIDGSPSTVEELMRLTPTDIESVSTLMDAASAAIYGARAAFGVVLVTTKTAKKEGMSVTYGSNVALRKANRIPKFIMSPDTVLAIKVLGSGGWYNLGGFFGSNEGDYLHQVSIGNAAPIRLNPSDPTRWQYAGSTNWYDMATKKYSISQDHDVSVSGKSKKVDYYFSGAYYRQEGIFAYGNDIYDKYNFRGKIDFRVNDWLTLSNNTSYVNSIYNEPSEDLSITALFSTQTTDIPKNPDGSWTYSGAQVLGALQDGGRSTSTTGSYNTAFTAKADVIKNLLSLTGRASFMRTNTDYRTYSLPIPYKTGPALSYTLNPIMSAQHNAQFDKQNVFDLYADVDKKIQKNSFHVMVGYNREYKYTDWFSAYRNNLISASVPSITLATGDESVGESISDWSTQSMFYRFNYGFDDKYLVEFNGRYDGTSRFPRGNRYGFFPSFSMGWNVAKEKFFEPITDYVSQLKPRFSYGNLGNQDVSAYFYLPSLSSGKTSSIIQGTTMDQQTTIYAPSLVASNLTWEKVRTANYGIDVGFLKNRLSTSFDYYHRATIGMLTKSKTLPSVLGASEPQMNAADLMTKGWELSASWNDQFNLLGSPLTYGFRVTLADSRSWVTKYDNPDGKLSDYYVGYEIGTIYGYQSSGLFQTYSQLKNHANQSSLWTYPEKVTPGPGDICFDDLNGDGVIRAGNTIKDMQDYKVIGNSRPRYQTSFTFNSSWKGFDINAFFQGVLKQQYYPTDIYFWGSYQTPWTNSQVYQIENMWTVDRRDAYLPRIKGYAASTWSGGELYVANTRYLQNAAYVRLKSMTVGYTLPSTLVKKMGNKLKISTARFYVCGENLWTWTGIKNKNLDPETLGSYPIQRVYSFGLNVSF